MITEWLLRVVAWLWEQIVTHLPSPEVPDWLASAPSSIAGVVSHLGGLGPWFPFSVLAVVLATVFVALAVSLGIKVARIVGSFMTFGGGSAG